MGPQNNFQWWRIEAISCRLFETQKVDLSKRTTWNKTEWSHKWRLPNKYGNQKTKTCFIWAVPVASYSNQGANKFTFGLDKVGGNRSFAIGQLEINNSIYYPQLDMTNQEESRLYRTLMSYSSAYNDFLSGSIHWSNEFQKPSWAFILWSQKSRKWCEGLCCCTYFQIPVDRCASR